MWELNGSKAQWRTEAFSASVDLGRPDLGVRPEAVFPRSGAEPSFEASLLALESRGPTHGEPLLDSWTRGADLFAAYGPRVPAAHQLEVYWRMLVDENAVGLEWIISVHTGLLDDQPTTWVGSKLPASTARDIQLDPTTAAAADRGAANQRTTCQLWRVGSNIDYVEMAHPQEDYAVESHVHGAGWLRRTRLFHERLEKGVIRRSRVRGWFLPADGQSLEANVPAARRLFRKFENSPTPLTT